ncbi:hypothetical protein [Aeromonas phage AerS_266]|nr:hypothetical protein [Aeromonas phage AerS_266]
MQTFKEQVIQKLSSGHEFIRIYAKSNLRSIIETRANGMLVSTVLQKLDIKLLFGFSPVIEIPVGTTMDDFYQIVSDKYNLGLEKGIDYYNAEPLYPTQDQKYISLPILNDSYGYYGEIPLYYTRSDSGVNGDGLMRDITHIPHEYCFRLSMVKLFFVSRIFDLRNLETNAFIGNRFTQASKQYLLNQIKHRLSSEFYTLMDLQITKGVVTHLFTDTLSDILVFKCPNGLSLFVRFTSNLDDIPDLNYSSTEDTNLLSDDSKELLLGESEQVSEKPDEGKGENYISDYEVINPNPSLTPEEKPEELIQDEIEEEIVVYLDPDLE